MKRTNDKTQFAIMEQAWDEVEFHFELYDGNAQEDVPCKIWQAEFMWHNDENNTDVFLIEFQAPEGFYD